MLKIGVILLFGLFIAMPVVGQQENALPLGPSIITQQLVDLQSKPIVGAQITVCYPDGKQRAVDTFVSDSNGRFSAYIFRYDQPYIDLKITYQSKSIKTIRYSNPGRGMNIGIGEKTITCIVN